MGAVLIATQASCSRGLDVLAAPGASLDNFAGSNSTSQDSTPALKLPSLPEIEVIDHWAHHRRLTELLLDETQAVAFVFLGAECPLAQVYAPTLIELERQFRGQGVQFIGVFSNAADDLLEMAAFAQDHEIPFPLVKDPNFELADSLQADRTPTVVLTNREFKVLYRGAINDQYRPGGRKPAASEHYLRSALTAILAGAEPNPASTLATGCHIDRRPLASADQAVTFSEHAAPIFQQHCQACHRPGQVAPFSLLDYEDAAAHAEMIAEVVQDRRMPPWLGKTDEHKFGKFANDVSLTDEEVNTLLTWARSGAKEGDPSKLPPPKQWPSDWTIGEPSVVIKMEEPFEVPADGLLPYKYFQVPTGFTEDKWVTAVEVRPGAAEVVHHILVHVTGPRKKRLFGLLAMLQLYGSTGEKAKIAAQFVSGDYYSTFPPGYAMRIPANSSLTLEVHYTPTGKPTQDQTSVAFVLADGPPEHEMKSGLYTLREFSVPPHDPQVVLTNKWKFEHTSELLSIKPLMHLRGKHIKYDLKYPDGRSETVLSVPRWDFDWQLEYRFAKPVSVPAGTELVAIAVMDNSKLNPNNPDPSVEVNWGLQNTDEMMHTRITYVEFPDED